jgi:CHAT domain-containing protein
MRLTGVIAGLVIISSCGGMLRVGGVDPESIWRGKAFEEQRVAGAKALQAGEYRRAIAHLSAGAEAAKRGGDLVSQGRFRANQGGAHMMLDENRLAIHCLLEGREAAAKSGDELTLQSIEASLANVYVLTGDYEAAAAAAARGAQVRPMAVDGERQARTLMSFGRAMAKARGVEVAAPMWAEALGWAEAAGSASLEADILDWWGNELVEQGRGGEWKAEEILARSWYKRTLAKDKRLPLTEAKLARMYRRQGKIKIARLWIDRPLRALERGQKITLPEWILRAEEAQIASEEGRLTEAMAGFRKSQRLVEQWRDKLPPAERLRLGAERKMAQELFEGYLQTAARLYRKEPSASLAADMFTLIQNTRAWSLDGNAGGTGADGPMYAEARRLEGRWLAGDARAGEELKTVRASILERESAEPVAMSMQRRGKLDEPGPGEAVLTFWLHEEGSWLWVWTAQGLRVVPLSERERIMQAAEAFRHAAEENQPDLREKGLTLRRLLLGGAEQTCLLSTQWDVVADEGLFQIPFGALPGRGERYLAEDVEVRLVPNALRHEAGPQADKRFFAVADPIFNRADERRGQDWSWQRVVHAGSAANGLPRLPGTRREADAAREAWRAAHYETAVYSGAESGETAVLSRLTEWQPRVIHFGTHTLEAQGRPRLVLSMRPDGNPGLLTAEDIAALRLRAELVVMSACHSAGSEAARGSGLLGLTRAWLTAGSRQVVSTLWPVGDESTAFFSTFYGRLARGEEGSPLAVAAALRQAQLACIRSGGVTAEPRHWAGHVLLARR